MRTDTGDVEGDEIETTPIPTRGGIEALRGEIELPIPAASAVKIDGERAYSLHRRGVAVEMPMRRSTVHALEIVRFEPPSSTLDLRVSTGTYIRSIADALGGHCVALRRTEVGPFRVEDADEERVLPPLAAVAAPAAGRPGRGGRPRRRVGPLRCRRGRGPGGARRRGELIAVGIARRRGRAAGDGARMNVLRSAADARPPSARSRSARSTASIAAIAP